jgi:sugar lactone lactonase YvrE
MTAVPLLRFLILVLALLAPLETPATSRAAGWLQVAAWGERGSGPGQMEGPKGIDVDARGDVYVLDYLDFKVMKFTADGTLITEWGGYGHKAGRFYRPSRLALGPDGAVYVTDTRNDRVQKFTADGQFVTLWGGTGTGKGRFDHPRGIAVGPDGLVYVTDERNERVEVFTQDGRYVRQWGHRGYSPGAFIWPKDIAVGPDGRVFVLDEVLCRLSVFSPTGELLHYWGTRGTALNQFKGPRGVTIDPAGDIFVADSYNDRLLEFAGDYTFLRRWAAYGKASGLVYAARDLAVAPDGTLYVSDFGNHRIVRYALSTAADDTMPRTTPSATGWHRAPVKLGLSWADPDDTATTTFYRFGTKAMFRRYRAPLTIGKQGVYTLQYFSLDAAGNQEAKRTSGLRVDWTRPGVRPAATSFSVFAGRTLTVGCTVADNMSPTCHLSLVFYQDGRRVGGASLGTHGVSTGGRAWRLPWTCTLARGQYSLTIRATDLAGNVGSAHGMALTVD